jgi:hypothetical protein
MGYHAFLYLWSLFFPSNEILLWSFNHSTRVDLEPTHHTATTAALTQLEPYFFLSPRSSRLLHNSLFLNEASKYNKWSPNDDAQIFY